MPVATADTTSKDLKSCPGGYVELRRLTYGQMLERRSFAANMSVPMGNGKRGAKQDLEGTMKLMDARTTLYEFSHCIVDHNLTDENERKLVLSQESDIRKLDPKVGEEIDSYISELNNFEAEDAEDPQVTS
jgi:hypothetical protein